MIKKIHKGLAWELSSRGEDNPFSYILCSLLFIIYFLSISFHYIFPFFKTFQLSNSPFVTSHYLNFHRRSHHNSGIPALYLCGVRIPVLWFWSRMMLWRQCLSSANLSYMTSFARWVFMVAWVCCGVHGEEVGDGSRSVNDIGWYKWGLIVWVLSMGIIALIEIFVGMIVMLLIIMIWAILGEE